MGKKVVVALGGNAILQPGQKGTPQEQLKNVITSCEEIQRIIKQGYQVIITHGNGPQVGNILVQQSAASDRIPAQTLDVCGSQTQGMLGYYIQQSLGNILTREQMTQQVATVVTQVEVDPKDKAFANPTKPIGAFYDQDVARQKMAQGEHWVSDAGRGWRKVVASPKPQAIVERDTIIKLVDTDTIVIAAGGGGIPVVKGQTGELQGIEAVIDKDLAAACLVQELEADVLLILTDQPAVYLNYGQPNATKLRHITVEQAQEYCREGHFAAGSMLPKVMAAMEVASRGKTAIITSLDKALDALQGKAGTMISLHT